MWGGWLNFEFSKLGGKHSGWAIKTIYKKLDRGILKRIRIVACEVFYVHNNIVIYLERRKTVPEELLHPANMYPSCNQISYSTDLCYITRRHQKNSLTSLLRLYHLSHVIADFGLCHITLESY